MRLARRDFLRSTVVATAAALLPPAAFCAPSSGEHRIVRVHNPLASCFDVLNFEYQNNIPESYNGHYVSQRAVDRNWGENPPVGWKNFGGRSPNCLLVGTDPVAMDSVVFDHVTESLPEQVKDFPPPNMLLDAAKVGSGCHESRKSAEAGTAPLSIWKLSKPPARRRSVDSQL